VSIGRRYRNASIFGESVQTVSSVEKGFSPILCIDDEPQVLEAIKLLLAGRYEVFTATDGVEGLKAMERTPFPVVVCDMRMPGMDGAQVVESVAKRWPTTVSVLLTGALAFDDASPNCTLPAFRLLAKPCDPKVLRETIQEALVEHQRLLETPLQSN
jgi:DNA-binding NtrC family response regulator